MSKILVVNNDTKDIAKYAIVINGEGTYFASDDESLSKWIEEPRWVDSDANGHTDTLDVYTLTSSLVTKDVDDDIDPHEHDYEEDFEGDDESDNDTTESPDKEILQALNHIIKLLENK